MLIYYLLLDIHCTCRYSVAGPRSNAAEGILHSGVAHWLSSDERYMAYVCFNVTDVPVYRFPVYGSASSLYSTVSEVRYPKVQSFTYLLQSCHKALFTPTAIYA